MNKKLTFTKTFTGITILLYYIPIFVLIIYSFNASRYLNVWGGFSLKWYKSLMEDEALLEAALISFKIAFASATISTIVGTATALMLIRAKRLHGKTFLTGMLSIPFVVPEVIIGASMLLLFIAFEKITGWPEHRNIFTVILAHTTIGIAYASMIIQTRLLSFDTSLEEAAMNLGASPLKTFFVITLPIISKGLIAGWLLAFTLSFDDLIISSFTSGPESTTLPMLIYSRIKVGLTPKTNVLATIMICIIIFVMTVVYFTNLKKKD
jgi:putrescine transport system permease protein